MRCACHVHLRYIWKWKKNTFLHFTKAICLNSPAIVSNNIVTHSKNVDNNDRVWRQAKFNETSIKKKPTAKRTKKKEHAEMNRMNEWKKQQQELLFILWISATSSNNKKKPNVKEKEEETIIRICRWKLFRVPIPRFYSYLQWIYQQCSIFTKQTK